MTTKLLTSLLMAALFASSAAFAADNAIQVSIIDGKQQAQFKVGDARCVLVDFRTDIDVGRLRGGADRDREIRGNPNNRDGRP